ncbi:MAG: TonB-dependent receptor [Bacteroidota bacterium]
MNQENVAMGANRNKFILIQCSVWILLLSGFVYNLPAQVVDQSADYFQLTLEELGNVVVTPSKLPQSTGNVTQKVDIINEEEIQSSVSGMRNICELIGMLPGVSISVLSRNDANWGTYGGIGPKYSTYMLQGLPIDAFIDPMSLDANILERIEVQRGPASMLYPNYLSQDFAGNQSPLAGTVNLILKEKVSDPKTVLSTSAGSYNTINAELFHENNRGPLNYFCGTSFEISDYTDYGAAGSWLNMQKNPEYQKTKLYGGLTWFLDKGETQKLTVFVQETFNRGDAGRIYRNFDNSYGTVNIGYTLAISKRLYFQTHVGLRTYDRMWQESIFGVVDTLKSANGVNQRILPTDLSLTWNHGKSNGLSIGLDYQNAAYVTWTDPLIGYRLTGNKASATQAGFYLQEEWRPVSGLLVRGGLRYAVIRNNIDLINGDNPGTNSVSWGMLLWSLGSRYSISDKLGVYVNGGTSFTPPGLKSSAGTIPLSDFGVPGRNGQLPNPDLIPENGLGFDAGIDFTFRKRSLLGIRGFYTIVTDAIVDNIVSQNPSQSQSINSGSTSSLGGEIEVSMAHGDLFSWFANLTCMFTNTVNDQDADQHNVEIPFSPKLILNLGAMLTTPFGLTIVPYANYNSGFFDGTSRTRRTFYKPGFLLNVFINQRVVSFSHGMLECFVRLYNLTDNDYELPWQFKNTGFAGMSGLRITF